MASGFCQSCSKLIDTDEARFTVSVLLQWKSHAEKRAKELLGKKSVGPFELHNTLVAAVATATQLAYTGTGNILNAPLPGFVRGYENYLSQLDPRFSVKATANGEKTFTEIRIKPGHAAKIDIRFNDEKSALAANRQWEDFIDTGKNIELMSQDFKIFGSPLFENLIQGDSSGVFVLEPQKTEIPATLYLKSHGSEVELEIASFISLKHSTEKKLFIEGNCLNGLFEVKLTYSPADEKIEINYTFNPTIWIGNSFSDIKNFPKVKKTATFLDNYKDTQLIIELNLNGVVAEFGGTHYSEYADLFEQICFTVSILDKAKIISAATTTDLTITDLHVSNSDAGFINFYASLLQNDVTYRPPYGKEILTYDESYLSQDAVREINTSGKRCYLKITGRQSEHFSLLGNKIVPPPFQTLITGFEAALFSRLDLKMENLLAIKFYAIEGTTITNSLEENKYFRSDQ